MSETVTLPGGDVQMDDALYPPGSGGTFDGVHNDLGGRAAADAHPSTAVGVAEFAKALAGCTDLGDVLALIDQGSNGRTGIGTISANALVTAGDQAGVDSLVATVLGAGFAGVGQTVLTFPQDTSQLTLHNVVLDGETLVLDAGVAVTVTGNIGMAVSAGVRLEIVGAAFGITPNYRGMIIDYGGGAVAFTDQESPHLDPQSFLGDDQRGGSPFAPGFSQEMMIFDSATAQAEGGESGGYATASLELAGGPFAARVGTIRYVHNLPPTAGLPAPAPYVQITTEIDGLLNQRLYPGQSMVVQKIKEEGRWTMLWASSPVWDRIRRGYEQRQANVDTPLGAGIGTDGTAKLTGASAAFRVDVVTGTGSTAGVLASVFLPELDDGFWTYDNLAVSVEGRDDASVALAPFAYASGDSILVGVQSAPTDATAYSFGVTVTPF